MFEHLKSEIKAHAIECFPNESCGIIVGDQYLKQDNIAEIPTQDFKLSSNLWLQYPIQAIVHSHPFEVNKSNWDPRTPSKLDMTNQQETGIPWGITATDGTAALDPIWLGGPIEPLVGRNFIHGYHDCFSLCCNYYELEHNIKIKDYPRACEWWVKTNPDFNGKSMYEENFEKEGFFPISLNEIRPGDTLLCSIQSPVINHAMILLDKGLILHHLANRLSRREPLGRWGKYINKAIRHKDLA